MNQWQRGWRSRWRAIGWILGVWTLVGVGWWSMGRAATEPGNVIALVEAGADAQQVAAAVNRLEGQAKLDRVMGQRLRPWFESLGEAEQSAYLDATLPAGFAELMAVVNAMSQDERRALVGDALRDLDDRAEQFVGDAELPVAAERIIDAGMESYFKDASAQAKLDLQPLIRRMQSELQGGGGGGPWTRR